MLDFTQISTPIRDFAEALRDSVPRRVSALALAEYRLRSTAEAKEEIRERSRTARTSWLVAEWIEPPDLRVLAPDPLRPCTVIGADGSQIVPDRHDSAQCCLLNVGLVALRYGGSERPTLVSRARLTDADDGLSDSAEDESTILPRRLAMRRLLDEITGAVELVEAEAARGESPCLAMCDGSLILWPLETETGSFRGACLSEMRQASWRARSRRVPIAGYISRPGSRDVVNSLRVAVCPHPEVNCDRFCPSRSLPPPSFRSPECAGTEGVTDADLFEQVLRPGERSAVFGSRSGILQYYGAENRIRFFYLNVGREIARVEIPAWAAEDPELLDRTHALCYDQAVKGEGYPVALAEAHELAVVRAPERDLFFQLIERELISRGQPIRASRKAISKMARRI